VRALWPRQAGTPLEERARHIMLAADGPAAAAWLCGQRRHRRLFHEQGAIDFTLRGEERMPKWMAVALEFLKKRKGWEVSVRRAPGCVFAYRVRWLRWSKAGRARSTGRSGRRT
jgi:hypothetical protein